jgi:hypothetical protein
LIDTNSVTQTKTSPSHETILFSCAGLGMGNASRVAAIIEALTDSDRLVGRRRKYSVLSWGAGHRFLNEYLRYESDPLFTLFEAVSYSRVRWFSYPVIFFRNVLLLRKLVQSLRPRLVVLDSDYHFPAFAGLSTTIVYLGQARDVLDRARQRHYRPATIREWWHFLLGERFDALFQRFVATEILVPCFEPKPTEARRMRKIPLVVRKQFLEMSREAPIKNTLAILLSGSQIEKDSFISFAERRGFTVLTPDLGHPFRSLPLPASTLDRFDLIVTQAGLSSISECIARSKFMIVVPIKNHPEQILNAMEIERLGLGIAASFEDLADFPELLKRIERHRAPNTGQSAVACDGAARAATLINDLLR